MLAPICLFTYNRLTETKQTVEALQKNFLTKESELFIFSDGAKNEEGVLKVNEVRAFLKGISGFKSVTIFESKQNKGLANSIIAGVTQIIEKYGVVIVLEDDLITSPNFLNFMNEALDFYANKPKVFSISGYSMDLPSLNNYRKDYYLGYRASSWGWATWLNKWENVDWEIKGYDKFKWNIIEKLKFMRGGYDMPYMLWKQMNGKIDSWAIRWCYYQFRKQMFTVFPTLSKVESIGFGKEATHTRNASRFLTNMDKTKAIQFDFDEEINLNEKLVKEFRNKFSLISRVKNRLGI